MVFIRLLLLLLLLLLLNEIAYLSWSLKCTLLMFGWLNIQLFLLLLLLVKPTGCVRAYTWQPTIGLNHAAQRHICRPRATVHLSQLTCRDGLFIFMVLPHLPTYSHCEWLHLATSTWLCAVIIRCGYVVVVFGGWMERSLIIIIIMWSSLCGPVVAV